MKKLLLFLLSVTSINAFSQNWNPQILTQPNQGVSHYFGHSVSIDGDYAVVGAPNENTQTGAANVYKKDANGNWNHIQKITAYVGKSQDEYFGSEVHIQGEYIFISSPTDRINEQQFQEPAGSVMIYKNDGNDNFVGIQRIRSSDIRIGDYFGFSIDSYEDYLVVGAPDEDHDVNGNNAVGSSGSVYVFRRDDKTDTWHEEQKLVTSHRATFDKVGYSVAIHGDYIVVGSQNKFDANNANPINGNGSAYVFKKDINGIWSEMQKLKPLSNLQHSSFGYNGVDIEGEFIAVGARGARTSMNFRTGAVYMFKLDGAGVMWNQFQVLQNPQEIKDMELGVNVAMKNNFLIASAPNDHENTNGNQNNSGSAIVYQYNGAWIEVLRVEPPDPELNAKFGGGLLGTNEAGNSCIDYNGTEFIIGIQLKDDNNFLDAGKAYISGDLNAILAALNVEDENLSNVKVYPNPIKDLINLNLPKSTNQVHLTIHNSIGKKVFEKEYKNETNLNISFPHPKGVYLAKITIDNKSSKTIKLVKN